MVAAGAARAVCAAGRNIRVQVHSLPLLVSLVSSQHCAPCNCCRQAAVVKGQRRLLVICISRKVCTAWRCRRGHSNLAVHAVHCDQKLPGWPLRCHPLWPALVRPDSTSRRFQLQVYRYGLPDCSLLSMASITSCQDESEASSEQ